MQTMPRNRFVRCDSGREDRCREAASRNYSHRRECRSRGVAVESVAGIDEPAPTGINDAGYNSARKRKKKKKAKSWQPAFCFSSRALFGESPVFLGGLIGALLLSHTGNRNFIEFVPWLVLLATIIIALRPVLVRRREGGTLQPDLAPMLWPFAMMGIFLVALYGGYFGAGIGILMIGALTFISPGEIRHFVALKNFLNGWMRGVAVLVLVLGANVNWKYGAPMAIGGLVGGYIGGIVSHRANRTVIRSIVIVIGLTVAVYYFWKLYNPAVIHVRGE